MTRGFISKTYPHLSNFSMKTFKIILVLCFVLIFVASAALFIFIGTFDSQRFKTQLTGQLSAQFERQVEMEDLQLSFSLFRGLFLAVKNFRIMDAPEFSPRALFGVETLNLDVNIFSFLTQKKIIVSRILIESPELNLVRNQEGVLNIQALSPQPKPSPDAPAGKSGASSGGQTKKETSQLPALLIHSVQVESGQMTFVDNSQDPSIVLILKDIALEVVGLSSTTPFKFTAGSSMFSETPNLKIKGQGQLDPKTLQVRLDNVKADFDLSAIKIDELEGGIPSLKASEWGLTLRGAIETLIRQVVVGQEGVL